MDNHSLRSRKMKAIEGMQPQINYMERRLPSLLGLSESVRPVTSFSPLTRTLRAMTARSGPQMQPLTLFLSPVLLGLYRVVLFLMRILTLPLTKIPCFMVNPCLSLPPVILSV